MMFVQDDNFISKDLSDHIEETLISDKFPWFFNKTSTIRNASNLTRKENPPGLSHMFYIFNQGINSNFFNFAEETLFSFAEKNNIEVKEILRAQVNLLIRSDEKEKITQPHVDFSFDHKVFIYYVNDSDGDTVLYKERYNKEDEGFVKTENLSEIKRISPVKGRGIVFDGLIYHSATIPSSSHKRMIFNIPFR